jgi:hypothetical protein
MDRRLVVRKKNILSTESGTKPIHNQVYGQRPKQNNICQPSYYPSYYYHTKSVPFRKPKQFAVSEKLAKASAPTLYKSQVIEKKVYDRDVFTINGHKPFYKYLHTREWITTDGLMIVDLELKEYEWRWTGHYNTYTGRKRSKASRFIKRGTKSDQTKSQSGFSEAGECPF